MNDLYAFLREYSNFMVIKIDDQLPLDTPLKCLQCEYFRDPDPFDPKHRHPYLCCFAPTPEHPCMPCEGGDQI